MPKSKYEQIYKSIKHKIDSGEYEEGSYLPSENTLIQTYNCSRNTIRRAISHLTMEGYVQPHHGKGVRVIHSNNEQHPKFVYLIVDTNGVTATGKKYGFPVETKVLSFKEEIIDQELANRTDFPLGTEVYIIERVRYVDGIAKMIDTNFLRKDVVGKIDVKIAEKSLFTHFTKKLGMEITTIKRKITVEHVTPQDEKYLKLNGFNCVPVITSRIYNDDGIKFEYTESRQRPDVFVYNSITTNALQPKKS